MNVKNGIAIIIPILINVVVNISSSNISSHITSEFISPSKKITNGINKTNAASLETNLFTKIIRTHKNIKNINIAFV